MGKLYKGVIVNIYLLGVKTMSQADLEKKLKNIHHALDEHEARQELKVYELAAEEHAREIENESPEKQELRALLLAIHDDERIAAFMNKKSNVLYDPNSPGEDGPYLELKGEDGKVQYAHAHSKSLGYAQSDNFFSFELKDGRFYDNECKREIHEYFPNLAAENIEQGLIKLLSD